MRVKNHGIVSATCNKAIVGKSTWKIRIERREEVIIDESTWKIQIKEDNDKKRVIIHVECIVSSFSNIVIKRVYQFSLRFVFF